jgi:hypothetical protein
MARVPNDKKNRLNRFQSSRAIVSGSAFARWWGEKHRLCCLGKASGAFCLVTLTGKTLSILPGFGK